MAKEPKYTEEERQILLRHYETADKDFLLSLLPGRTWRGILKFSRENLNLSREHKKSSNPFFWDDNKDKKLVSLLQDHTQAFCAEILGCSRHQLQDRLRFLQTTTHNLRSVSWTEQEIQIIQEHFCNAPKNYLLRLLPNRCWNQIYNYGKTVLHLSRTSKDVTYLNYKFFDNWTEQSAYVLGFIMADGYIHLADNDCHRNILSICLHERDKDIIDKIMMALSFEGKVVYHKGTVTLQISNRHLIEQVALKGIPVKDKSYCAQFPDTIPEPFVKHFIRGLIDGDGWIQYKYFQGTLAFGIGLCGTYGIVEGTRDRLLPNCSDIQLVKNTDINFKINIRGKRAFKIASWLYQDATIYLNRKYNIYVQAKEKYLRE